MVMVDIGLLKEVQVTKEKVSQCTFIGSIPWILCLTGETEVA